LQLDVEGHGRDTLAGELDVSRTVGWFTTVFPLGLSLDEQTPHASLREVQRKLAELPIRGAAHGLARYLSPDPELRRALGDLPRSQLLFNYLGNVDAQLPPDSPLRWATEPTGRNRSPKTSRAYRIEINAYVSKRCLTLDVEYSRTLHHEASVVRFSDELRSALGAMSSSSSLSGDIEFAGLASEELDRVAELLAEVDEE
jgi:non-ribosomal peptide synthase protein (TIGR01720 family)